MLENYTLAISCFKQIRAVSLLCNCYEMMIQKEKNPSYKYDYMSQYADLCKDYGRTSKAIEIYQIMLD